MRTVEIDVVDVQADAGFEAGYRVLLTDAADECRQRRIGTARYLERHVRALLRDFDDIDRADALQVDAADHGDRQRDIHQGFLAPPCRRDDDLVHHLVGAAVLRRRRRGKAQQRGRCECDS